MKYSVLRQCDLTAWISPVGGGYSKTMLTVILVLYCVTIASLASSVSDEQELNPVQKVSVFMHSLCIPDLPVYGGGQTLSVYRYNTVQLTSKGFISLVKYVQRGVSKPLCTKANERETYYPSNDNNIIWICKNGKWIPFK